MYIKFYLIVFLTLIGLPMAGCNKTQASDKNVIAVEQSDSIPSSVKKLVRAVADNDTDAFANMVNYPLQRPYPLHNIDNAEEMKSRYGEVIDDSLRNIIKGGEPKEWNEYGWRGWSLKDGQYIWVDDGVYDVQYISQSERKKIDSLINVEINSIDPSIREGWLPVLCLRDSSQGNVYRIDRIKKGNRHHKKPYRMAVYHPKANLRGVPSEIFDGDMDEEGSANTIMYRFTVNPGKDIIVEPDSPETGNPVLIQPNDSVINLQRAYWYELIDTVK